MMNALEREMDDLFVPPRRGSFGLGLRDEGDSLVLHADLPGFDEGDVDISLESDVLTLRAERRRDAAEGACPVRAERVAIQSQRYALPCRVDGDAATAVMKDGVLTITLPKAKEARPRRIALNSISGDGSGSRTALDPKSVS